MADVQKYFETFHDAIKLKKFDENQILREKRDIVLDKLKSRLKTIFEEKDEPVPTYQTFDQGSYKMGTGIIPLDSDYDIDVGVSFNVSKDNYLDPVEVKEWVYDALNGHTKKVDMRRPCVTVFYQKGDEPVYHVDLAVYSDESCNSDGKKYLAKGKLNSSDDNKCWEISEPQKLADTVGDKHAGDDKKQFVMVIRYLKRWKDYNFSSNGNAAPIGIGLTIAAYNWFTPNKTLMDIVASTYKYNDLQATRGVVNGMLNNFGDRLRVYLPVEPYSELFEKMTDNQMATLKEKLGSLLEALDSAASEVDPVKACETLKKVFGDDFPVPEKPDTGEKKSRAISTASASAHA
ncbi:nucleotidyltransferase domain-containing protein [Geotalea uraniireducens]|uniref:Cyclic GMP-AMP synthase n=1 Tax=Geotalea uraniireducens (strain Rf4) TaxID=351605 RepID=A5G3N0_GEOUR|nr:nucleotidyltransferase [Geotalea uraniireducens]ABQ26398.1 hypothetical protein Gura_2213 [Geotalea uraniireducens Rf4]